MVKSFTGVRKAPTKEFQQIQVRDYMSSKLTLFRPDQHLEEVVKTMLDKNISGGPVVNEDGQLIGIISEGDCLKEIVKGKYTNTPSRIPLVRDLMVHEVKTIGPNVSVLDVAGMFLSQRVRRFPVIEDGKLIGQISQRDVMRAVQALKNETW
jgi:CBS domain-containing protein